MSVIMQGDQYGIPIPVKTLDGTLITADMFEDVEIVIGDIIKTYKSGKIDFNEERQEYIFPLTQEDSFSFKNMRQSAQIRFKYPNGEVYGISLGDVDVMKSKSKAVL